MRDEIEREVAQKFYENKKMEVLEILSQKT